MNVWYDGVRLNAFLIISEQSQYIIYLLYVLHLIQRQIVMPHSLPIVDMLVVGKRVFLSEEHLIHHLKITLVLIIAVA